MIRVVSLFLVVAPLAAFGCTSIALDSTRSSGSLARAAEAPLTKESSESKGENRDGDSNKDKKNAKTLLDWAVPTKGQEEKKENGRENGNGREETPNSPFSCCPPSGRLRWTHS